jgi:hypothetical protein
VIEKREKIVPMVTISKLEYACMTAEIKILKIKIDALKKQLPWWRKIIYRLGI